MQNDNSKCKNGDGLEVLGGYTLIELLIVLAIMAAISFIALPEFRDFNSVQQLKGAGEALKSDLRLAQNRAATGERNDTKCPLDSNHTFKGWYVDIDKSRTPPAYRITGWCYDASAIPPNPSDIDAPVGIPDKLLTKGITIDDVAVSVSPPGSMTHPTRIFIKFPPLGQKVQFYKDSLSDANLLTDVTKVDIIFKQSNTGQRYQVTMYSSGSVSEMSL